MPRFIKRSARIVHEFAVVLKSPSPGTFGDIGTDTVCGTNHLLPDSVPRDCFSFGDHFPNDIRKFLGQLIHAQTLKPFPASHTNAPIKKSHPPQAK
jgi:hypothetical protein